MIAEKKDGSLRICIDPRELNKALQREHYTLPVLEDSLHELGRSRFFTKADLASGYWHVELDDESSMLTTFQTCHGRYRWRRLPFGTKVSSEIFQKRLLEVLGDLKGVVVIADDIIIHGETQEEHDRNLEKFLQRCREVGIRLNKTKFQTGLNSVDFMGHQVTPTGMKPDPEKVRAILDMEAPEDVAGVRRFIGTVNYLARFLPHLSQTLQPLQNLLQKDVPFNWSSAQEEAFDHIKQKIASSPVLAFFQPDVPITLQNDASEYGLGAVLMQKDKPVAYASRSLKPAERNYAQIEKEMLAIVFGLEKFHHYTYGVPGITVVTDHKPLVAIMNKPLSKAPRRLQAMLLRLQPYSIKVEYQPGSTLAIADTLSRAPLPDSSRTTETVTVNNLQWMPVKRHKLDEIRGATEQDGALQKLRRVITNGWPRELADVEAEVKPYFSYRDELTTQDGIILRGDRIVIPTSMRKEVKQKAHAGHMGINACIRRARDLVFWPGMSKEIRQLVESCETCARHANKQQPETLHMHPVPDRPWAKVGTDLFTISGRDYCNPGNFSKLINLVNLRFWRFISY